MIIGFIANNNLIIKIRKIKLENQLVRRYFDFIQQRKALSKITDADYKTGPPIPGS